MGERKRGVGSRVGGLGVCRDTSRRWGAGFRGHWVSPALPSVCLSHWRERHYFYCLSQ